MNIQITLGASPEVQKIFGDLTGALEKLQNANAVLSASPATEAAARTASVKAAVEKNQAASIAKPAKKTKAAVEPEEMFDLGNTYTEDEISAEKVIEYTQKDVMSAFKEYLAASGKDGRANAEKILKKYKVVSIKDIKEENYADVIDALKALEE